MFRVFVQFKDVNIAYQQIINIDSIHFRIWNFVYNLQTFRRQHILDNVKMVVEIVMFSNLLDSLLFSSEVKLDMIYNATYRTFLK